MLIKVYNCGRGAFKVIDRVLPRWHTMEVSTDQLADAQLDELRAAEAYKSLHITPSLIPAPQEQTPEAPVIQLVPRRRAKARR